MKNKFGLFIFLAGAVLIVIGAASPANTIAYMLLGLVMSILGLSSMSATQPRRRRHLRTIRRTLSSSTRSPTTYISP